MERWIVLLRGVNVGGHNKLKMADFRAALEGSGYLDVATYIQSGNAVLRSDRTKSEIVAEVSTLLKSRFEIDVPVLVLSAVELREAVAENPFEGDLSRIILWFSFEDLADFDSSDLNDLKAATEEAAYTEKVIYLHAPEGIARSKFAEKIDRLVPVQLTARNLRSARKILELAS